MRLVALQSFVSSKAASVSGYSLPPWLPCFQSALWSYPPAGPRALASPGSSSPELSLLFRVSTAPYLPRTAKCEDAFLGVSLPIATSACGVHYRASFPVLALTVRPQRFSRSRRLAPPHTLRVCFAPQPRPGFTFQGFSPAAKPGRLVGDPCPPVVRRLLPPTELPRWCQLQSPRLQGLDPGSDPKPPPECLAPPTLRSPPRFQLPRDFLRTPWKRLRASSTHDLDRQTLRVTLAVGLQRINQCPTRYSVPRLPSRSSFPACLAHPPKRVPGARPGLPSGPP
jgi:hypothetical protein